MAYEPNAPTREERDGHYSFVWIGLLASTGMVTTNFIPMGHAIEGFLSLIAGIYIALIGISNRFDDYFKRLAAYGFRWMAVAIALWTVAIGLLTILEGYFAGGISAAGTTLSDSDQTFLLPAKLNSGHLIAAIGALAFHCGFLCAYLRGHS